MSDQRRSCRAVSLVPRMHSSYFISRVIDDRDLQTRIVVDRRVRKLRDKCVLRDAPDRKR